MDPRLEAPPAPPAADPDVAREMAREIPAEARPLQLGMGAREGCQTPLTIPVASTKAPKKKRTLRRLALDVALGAGCMLVLHLCLVQISVVRGHSMEPCLHDGDRLLVDRVSYTLLEVARHDVIVLRYPRNPEIDFVKRVVGLPGETVAIRGGTVVVDGEPLRRVPGVIPDAAEMPPLRVPAGQYFVLGDNRPVSCDSREFGLVAEELIKGKVRARFWPLDRASMFD